jgi:hypothetical protein
MAILPMGKIQKPGEGNGVLNTLREWIVKATRLPLKRENAAKAPKPRYS